MKDILIMVSTFFDSFHFGINVIIIIVLLLLVVVLFYNNNNNNDMIVINSFIHKLSFK